MVIVSSDYTWLVYYVLRVTCLSVGRRFAVTCLSVGSRFAVTCLPVGSRFAVTCLPVGSRLAVTCLPVGSRFLVTCLPVGSRFADRRKPLSAISRLGSLLHGMCWVTVQLCTRRRGNRNTSSALLAFCKHIICALRALGKQFVSADVAL